MNQQMRAEVRENLRELTAQIDQNGMPFTDNAITVLIDCIHAVDQADAEWAAMGQPTVDFYIDSVRKYMNIARRAL